MPIALKDSWIWDSWYAHDGQRWHGYFLQAPKSLGNPELRHWHVTQGHAVSTDLVNWTHLGTCLEPSSSANWDDYTTWTGSVVQQDDGLWHLFYTGTCRAEKGLYQRIGHAVSSDMHHWQRVGNGLCLDLTGPNAHCYESEYLESVWHDRAMRDPWVMRDPQGDGWLMYFTARTADVSEVNAAGAIGFASSPDLYDWTLHAPVFVGGYGQLEVPQVFERDGRWYCIFCTSARYFSVCQAEQTPGGPVTGTHYLIADNPRGPWAIAPGPFLDGAVPCRRYAARIVDAGEGLVLLGFMDQLAEHEFGGFIMDPETVIVDDQGGLQVQHNTTEFQ